MNIELTDEQRQLIINMADLWIRDKGAAGAGQGLVVINLMQTSQEEVANDEPETKQKKKK